MESLPNDYPRVICLDCGKKYGTVTKGHMFTVYLVDCGWCGERKEGTEPRDFRYPPFPPPK